MLAVSICLRLCMMLGLDAKAAAFVTSAAETPEFARWMLFLETGRVTESEQEDPLPRLWVLQVEREVIAPEPEPVPAPEPEPPPKPEPVSTPSITPVSADRITVSGGCTYSYDKAGLLARPTAMHFPGEGPQILIVHTHGSEAYTPEPGLEYEDLDHYRTLDPSRSVIAVGQCLAQTLEAYGFSVIHDTAVNDYPSYNDSYWTTLSRIQQSGIAAVSERRETGECIVLTITIPK